MIDGISFAQIVSGPAAGWVALVTLLTTMVIGLWRGWVVPGPTARMWFEAWQTDRHTVDELATQVKDIAQGQLVITKILNDFNTVAGERASEERGP